MKSPLIALTVVSALAACIALLVVTPTAAAQDPTVRAAIESQIARVVEARKRSDPEPFLMILDTAFSITTLTGEPIDRRRYEATRQQNWRSVVSVKTFTITVDSLRTAQDEATVFTTQRFDRSDRAADGTLRDVSSTTTARETWVLVGSEWLLKHREDLEPSVTTVDGNPVPVDRAGRAFVRIFWEHGVDEARRVFEEAKRRDPGAVLFEEAKRRDPGVVLFGERTLNVLGYNLLERGRLADAIGVFELNVAAYPEAWNTYDSLGEAYAIAGHPDLAVTHYRRSLALNPDNQNAAEMLARLEVDTSPPDAAQLGIPLYHGARYVPEFVEGLEYQRMEWQEEAAVYQTDDSLETVLAYFQAVPPDLPAPRHAGEAVVFEQLLKSAWEIQTVPVGVLPASFLGDVPPQTTTRLVTGMIPIRASDVFVTLISPHPSPDTHGLASGTLIIVLRQRRPPTPPPLPTLAGPETTDLLPRLNGYLAHAGDLGFEVLELPSRRASTIEGAGSPNSLHDVVGPDPVGRVVYVEIPGQNRHVVKTMRMDGTDDRVLIERPGDPIWQHAIGSLALSPDGERLAFVGQAEELPVGGGVGVPAGSLEIWNIRERTGGPLQSKVLWGLSLPGLGGTARELEVLSWFPDARRLLFVELVPRAELSPELAKQAAEEFFAEGWDRVPVIAVLDVVTMEKRQLRVGLSPLAGPGGRVLMEVEPGHYHELDLATGEETTVEWPGDWRGPIAYLGDDLLVYRGLPTEGAPPRYTVNNSPMVGPKPMGNIKVVDLRTGRFQTILEGVDPRDRYIFTPKAEN